MKSKILILALIISTACFAEIYKSTEYSVQYFDSNGFSMGNSRERRSSTIFFDTSKYTLDICSDTLKHYDIDQTKEPVTIKVFNQNWFIMYAKDDEGRSCVLKFKQVQDTMQLYIYYNEVAFVYNLK